MAADGQQAPLEALRTALSAERFGTYMAAVGDDEEAALRLYRWNSMASSSFFGALHMLEVTLRNAMHDGLLAMWGDDWWDHPGCGLNDKDYDWVQRTITDLLRQKDAITSPDVVAALPFGFWVSLLGSGGRDGNYETKLWRPVLNATLPHRPMPSKRKSVALKLNYLRTFRNRIAHHEPIFHRALHADHSSILEVVGWIEPAVAGWVKKYSRVPAVLSLRGDVLAGVRDGTL